MLFFKDSQPSQKSIRGFQKAGGFKFVYTRAAPNGASKAVHCAKVFYVFPQWLGDKCILAKCVRIKKFSVSAPHGRCCNLGGPASLPSQRVNCTLRMLRRRPAVHRRKARTVFLSFRLPFRLYRMLAILFPQGLPNVA